MSNDSLARSATRRTFMDDVHSTLKHLAVSDGAGMALRYCAQELLARWKDEAPLSQYRPMMVCNTHGFVGPGFCPRCTPSSTRANEVYQGATRIVPVTPTDEMRERGLFAWSAAQQRGDNGWERAEAVYYAMLASAPICELPSAESAIEFATLCPDAIPCAFKCAKGTCKRIPNDERWP